MKITVAILLALVLAACTGVGKSSNNPMPAPNPTPSPTPSPTPTPVSGPITVMVAPASVTVPAGTEFSHFTASVTNTSNVDVTWMVDNIAGGNSTVGTIDPSGHYVAPQNPGNHTVTAVSVADTSKSGSAQVTVTRTITVSVSPATATVQAGATQQFSATITGTTNLGVNWLVDGIGGGNNSAGTIDNNGLYKAPSTSGTHTITATSVVDNHSSGTAQVTVPPGIAISPQNAQVQGGASQQFTVTVTDPALVNVIWSVDGATGGSSSSGTISITGLYVAPASAGSHTIGAASVSNPSVTATAKVTVAVFTPGVVSVLTYHNDNARTGQNLNESILSPSNVNQAQFGKVFSFAVDGQMYAQPLYVSNVSNIAGGTHNVVFAATEHNTVYAFDADGLNPIPLWQRTLGPSTSSADVEGISPELGITGTPVIDPNSNTLYVVTDNRRAFNLHALDIATGAEKFGGPKRVTATVSGSGADSQGGTITLEGGCYQRMGLALLNGVVYIGFGHCSHGWLLGYDAGNLSLINVINTTPNGAGGALWMSGGGTATDDAGNLYVITGVDTGDPASGFNDTFLKLGADLSVGGFFTPSNEAFLRQNDADLGSGAPVVLPDNASAHPHELVGGGKDGRIFLLDRDNMGAVQVIPDIGTQQFDNLFDTPAFWNGNLYYHAEQDVLKVFQYNNGLLSTNPTSRGRVKFGLHGATPSVSANRNSNAIVWEIEAAAPADAHPADHAVLRAYDALNLGNEIYDSNQSGTRDIAGPGVKFTVPTIANGNVYVGTGNELDVYGLLPH